MAAIDFTSVEVWTKNGLVTFYLLFVMELKTRRVHFAGNTISPDESWMKQTARELTNHEDSDGVVWSRRGYSDYELSSSEQCGFRQSINGQSVPFGNQKSDDSTPENGAESTSKKCKNPWNY
ncbi:hypothetical protein N8639_02010 [bacterium]|nr:hypothetical protein [bacterium]